MASRNLPHRDPPEVCPVCGKEVPRNARACRQCGSDYESGWQEAEEIYDGLDLPDEDFDYDKFVEEEFGNGKKQHHLHPVWWITAVILLIATILGYIASGGF